MSRIMRTKTLFWVGLILLLVGLGAAVRPLQASDADNLLRLLNQARADAGTHALTMNSQLVVAAQRHSNDMASGEFLSHTGSDGSSFSQRITDAGYRWNSAAENVLFRFDLNAAGAFNQWWNSTGHRNNMMNTRYCDIGIAHARSQSGRYYYTMVLARKSNQNCSASPTAVPTTPPSSGSLNGTVAFEGRGTDGAAVMVELYQGGSMVSSQRPTLNANGGFTLNNLSAGTYSVWVKHNRFLAAAGTVTISGGTSHNFGTLLAGDANNDNQVTLADFSVLSTSYNRTSGTAGYDGRADFNNDSQVTLPDFSLLSKNFNRTGAARP